MSKRDLQALIKSTHKQGATGILRVRAAEWPDHDLFFLGGDLIACGSPDDPDRMGALLVAAGAVDATTLSGVRAHLGEDQDLADELVHAGTVAGDAVMAARAHLFADNLAWASVAPAPGLDFEAQDAVFPPNMQFGLELQPTLSELKAWARGATAALDALHTDTPYTTHGSAPEDLAGEAWEALGGPLTALEAIELLGPPRRAAVRRAAELLAGGSLIPASDVDAEDTEVADEAPGAGPALEEEATASEPTDQITEEDYERAARGGFIKSYDVLDKVDLSGVAVLGAEKVAPHDESHPAIEAMGAEYDDEESAIELGDADSMEGITALRDEDLAPALPTDTRPEVAPVAATADDIELMSDDFALFEGDQGGGAPPVQEIEIAYDGDDDALAEEPLAALVLDEEEDAGATGTINVGDDHGVFGREALNEFHHRIDVFNNIFRIIFRSFSEHIGGDKAQQRFNALLSSSQRQYPELFENLSVDGDGSILPAPLINNLGNCPPGDYGSLLHQGLYELIFSHLYDAKDMLPGTAETDMMEQIVVYERRLHRM